MRSFEIRVAINRPVAAVFAVYTQADTFRWCSYIRTVRWVRGRPWEVESRMRIETDNTFGEKVDQVLMHLEPNRRAEFLSHSGGITLQTRVTFQALSANETEIKLQMEFVGVFSRIAGFAVETTIERRSRQFFDDLKRACERTPATLAASAVPVINPPVPPTAGRPDAKSETP
jgi:uncharacterized membrane protein